MELSGVESGEGLEAGEFQYLHVIWVGDGEVAEQNCDSAPIFEEGVKMLEQCSSRNICLLS